jgi:mannose/fructose/N-acetylgalactosamine-specific phosphotransferase system component IID
MMIEPVMTPWMKARIVARLLLLQARWDPARMQAVGLAFALEPWLAECWAGDCDGLRAARRRHLEYFNTHPIAAWLAAGVLCRLEVAAAALSGADRDAAIGRIRGLKTNLGASLAGLYDSFFWGGLRPVSALAGVLAAQAGYQRGWSNPPAWGVATALLAYNAPAFAARAAGFLRGWNEGEGAVVSLCRLPVQAWIRGLRWGVIGGALASFAAGTAHLGVDDRMTAGLIFAGGFFLTRRGFSTISQLGLAGAGGMAASFVGL